MFNTKRFQKKKKKISLLIFTLLLLWFKKINYLYTYLTKNYNCFVKYTACQNIVKNICYLKQV